MEDIPSPRIVSLSPSATRILWELGAAEPLAGATRWCNKVVPVQALQSLPVPGDCWSLDAEAVVRLDPDLMINSASYRTGVR